MTSRFTRDGRDSAFGSSAGTDVARSANVARAARPTETATACATGVEAPATELTEDVFIPEHYEANYAYPLVVWLAAEGAGNALHPLMRRISDRNFIGAAVRSDRGSDLNERLPAAVARLRKRVHVHSERVFLAGVGAEGTLALETALARPEWYAGAIALSPRLPHTGRWLARYDDLRAKRVFLAAEDRNPQMAADVERMQRLLWTAGLSVRACRHFADAQADDGLLRAVDRWLIDALDA